jgi:hypothetical protein
MHVAFNEMNFQQQIAGCISEEGYDEDDLDGSARIERRPSLTTGGRACVLPW